MTIVARNQARRRFKDAGQRTTVVYAGRDAGPPSKHERETHDQIARGLAALQGYEFGGAYDPTIDYLEPLYLVPTTTLTDCKTARRMGVSGEKDLFGGVVPYEYMATKAITHPLVDSRAFRPKGWSEVFSTRVAGATLFGFSAFTLDDARRAGARLLERGPARIKPGNGVGGRGQSVARDMEELNQALVSLGEAAISHHGLVIEQNLEEVTTFSIGQVRIRNLVVSYHGKQRLTEDNQGSKVYGGSDLTVVRGDYDRLLSLNLSPEARLAIEQARAYDEAANDIPGFIASRRNYDVAQGGDAQKNRCSGVLEQSWRIGGASAAELAALLEFGSKPRLQIVEASCFELYGGHTPPPGAVVQFHGIDDHVGPILKYTIVRTDVRS